MNSNATRPNHRASDLSAAVNAVSRAISDLRRGMPIVLDAGDQALLVSAAESGRDPKTLMDITGFAATLLITASRAEALGYSPDDTDIVSISPQADLTVEAVAAIIGVSLADTFSDDQRQTSCNSSTDPLHEAAVELVKLARLLPAALTTPIPDAIATFVKNNDLLVVSVEDITAYRGAAVELLTDEISAVVPLEENEETRLIAFRPADGGKAHLAIVVGDPDPQSSVLVRLHSECFTGDLLGSLRCDCGDQLRGAIAAISAAGSGILLYLAQEGRGIGLTNKLRAYRLQDDGFDTIEANEALGFGADERVYAPAAQILQRLGYRTIRLMTNNPDKVDALADHGIEITARVPHAFPANGHNEQYLRTKAVRGGHLF